MKTIKNLKLIIPLIFLFIAQGCILVVDDEPLRSSPECEIISLVKVNGDAVNYSKFRLKIVNNSIGSTAYQVNCSIKMKIGSIVVDRSTEQFGDIYYRESLVGDVYIYNLYDHSDYNYAEVTLSWEDEFGHYYEKVYVY